MVSSIEFVNMALLLPRCGSRSFSSHVGSGVMLDADETLLRGDGDPVGASASARLVTRGFAGVNRGLGASFVALNSDFFFLCGPIADRGPLTKGEAAGPETATDCPLRDWNRGFEPYGFWPTDAANWLLF